MSAHHLHTTHKRDPHRHPRQSPEQGGRGQTHCRTRHRAMLATVSAQAPFPPFTIGVFFDKRNIPISADVNWNHQSSFYSECAQCTSIPGWPAISSAFNWVTATIFYRLPYGLELDFKAKNLTDSMNTAYLNGNPLLPYSGGLSGSRASDVGLYSSFGRTYSLGVTWTFGQG